MENENQFILDLIQHAKNMGIYFNSDSSSESLLNDIRTKEQTLRELRDQLVVLNYLKTHHAATTQEQEPEQTLVSVENQELNTTFLEEVIEIIQPAHPNNESVIASKPQNPPKLTLGDQLRKQGILNLEAVIGISEKFLFIKELFKGNSVRYHQEILNFNSFPSREEAFFHLDSLKNELAWKVDSVAYEELLLLLERKYPL